MRYRVVHVTKYQYSGEVSLSHNQMRLSPRILDHQLVELPRITISPEPTLQRTWVDTFGNRTHFFSIEQSHQEMEVRAESIVERHAPGSLRSRTHSWEEIASKTGRPRTPPDREAAQFAFDSRYAKSSQGVRDFAEPSFFGGRNLIEAVTDLTARIFEDFEYDPQATQISTPTNEVLELRRGVCQDFAHLQIACLRSMGLPARYVSGYLLTHAPPGKEKLIGSDASHAWVSAYVGDGEWLDFDPTNNLRPSEEHITIGWGRDYADISPIQGILIGGGQTLLSVSVDVRQIEGEGSSQGRKPS
jgi:transglutaminase-like putative cysteine protease